jgi:hypothetical protein
MSSEKKEVSSRLEDIPGSALPEVTYCTFFDAGYLSKGLALIESIRANEDTNKIFVVCLDDFTFIHLQSRAMELNLQTTKLDELLKTFPELEKARRNRTAIEFLFTISPFVTLFCSMGRSENHVSIYLDADLYFFEDPKSVIKEIDGSSIAIIRHNYPWFLRHLEKKYGTYNVGLLAFRNDLEGRKVLNWWAKSCIEWCFDYPKDGKYADQGYLNHFSKISDSVKVLENPGFNLAPWNTASRKLSLNYNSVRIDNSDLIFFHFHGLKRSGDFWVSSQLNYYSPLPNRVFKRIYGRYVSHLMEIESQFINQIRPLSLIQRRGKGLRGLIANMFRAFFVKLSAVLGQAIKR